jgi:hypothetical protein
MDKRWIVTWIVAPLVSACATVPTGPSVMVLPGHGKSFEQFQGDDAVCRQWAAVQTGATPREASAAGTAGGAAVGTAVGAAAGAGIGAAAGSPAGGAAVGAGLGLLGGTAIGAAESEGVALSLQGRYDMAYEQCMYAKGNQIPVGRGVQYTPAPAPPPAPRALPPGVPPPPPGPPPPPPPGVSR